MLSISSTESGGGEEVEEIEEVEPEDNLTRARRVMDTVETEGHLEAPINLNISEMTHIELNPLLWYNHDIAPKKIKLTNTGHTAKIYQKNMHNGQRAKWTTERPYIIGGPFLEKYVFSQLHFHWGKNEMVGSEHHLDGSCMPMELHVVNFKADYLSQDEALKYNDGISILVFLFMLQSKANTAFTEILDALPLIRDPGDSIRLTRTRPLMDFMRPYSDDYFAYWGALATTTEETRTEHRVLWIVSREPIGITQEQIGQFRQLYSIDHEPLIHNCRELQERQDRTIFHVNPSGKASYTLLPIPYEPAPLTANQMANRIREPQFEGNDTESINS